LPDIAWVNGRFSPLEQAYVSVQDRGFQFGDAVYEVLRAYDGRIFAVDRHVDRLRRSCRLIRLQAARIIECLSDLLAEALHRSEYTDAILYAQITRGVARRSHRIPAGLQPTCVLTVRSIEETYKLEQANGVTVIGLSDIRWARGEIKSTNLLASVLLKQRAAEEGAFEAVLFNGRDELTEGASTNVFIVTAGRLRTPALSERILAGVTRQVLLELAEKAGIPVSQETITCGEVVAADEMFLASTSIEVLPAVVMDGRPIGAGRPGPITRHLQQLYQRAVRNWPS
jgi:D-alanine transaminase